MADVRGAVATQRDAQKERQLAAARFIEKLGPQMARALPARLTPDRMTRLALTAVRQTPALAECSEVSMAGALLTAAALGLEPNTPTGECYLVPYSREVQFQLGYQGMAKLFWNHPLAAGLECEAVYEADEFSYSKGSNAHLHHVPNKRVPDRGAVIYYYAFVKLTTGAEHFEVLTPAEVKELRQGKVGPSASFKGGDPMDWMGRKTALRQAFKLIPKTTEMAHAVDADDKQSGTELFKAAAAERDVTVNASKDAVVHDPAAIEGGVDTSTGEVAEGGQS